MLPRLPLILAKRYVAALRKEDVPVVRAWLVTEVTGHAPEEEPEMDVVLAIEDFSDTSKSRLKLAQIARKVDPRIQPHPYDRRALEGDDPFVAVIREMGLAIA